MAVRTSAITVSAMAALLTLSGQAFAGYSMSGDAASLTVVADNAPRNEVIAGITDRLSVQRKGAALPEDLVSGVFTGNLSQVLNAILPHNGFVVAYRDGQPVDVTFTGPASRLLQPPVTAADMPIGNRTGIGSIAQTGIPTSQPVGPAGDLVVLPNSTRDNRSDLPTTDAREADPGLRPVGTPLAVIDDPLHLVPSDKY